MNPGNSVSTRPLRFVLGWTTILLGILMACLPPDVAAESGEPGNLELRLSDTSPETHGSWKMAPERGSNRTGPKRSWFNIQLREPGGRDRMFSRPAEQFPELFVRRAPDGPVQFEVGTEAGELRFEGERSSGAMKGTWTFRMAEGYVRETSPSFSEPVQPIHWLLFGLSGSRAEEIAGFASTGLRFSAEEFLVLKGHGVQRDYVEQLRRSGQEFAIAGIVRLRDHGVAAGYPGVFKSGGYDFKAEDYCLMRDHGVSAQEALVWKEAGYSLSAAELSRLRDHAVSSDYPKVLPKEAFQMTPDDFTRLRDHGVSPGEVAAWRKAGFTLDAASICRLRDHSVSADYGRSAKDSIPALTLDELIRLRNHGVPEAYMRQLKEIEPKIHTEDLIQLRAHGVDSGYVRQWREAGSGFSIKEIIRLRDHGVPVAYARAVQSPKNKPITVSTLLELHAKGLSPDAVRQLRE